MSHSNTPLVDRKRGKRQNILDTLICVFVYFTSILGLCAQSNVQIISGTDENSRRPIITSVPFLSFAPDA